MNKLKLVAVVLLTSITLSSCGLFHQSSTAGWKISSTLNSRPDYLLCPASQTCFAGEAWSHLFLKTNDSGRTWIASTIPKSKSDTDIFQSMSCPTTTTCVVVGDSSEPGALILITNNSGRTWKRDALPQSEELGSNGFKVSCSKDKTCLISSENTIWREQYGTFNWEIVGRFPGKNDLIDYVACESTKFCFLQMNNNSGVEYLFTSNNAGTDWKSSSLEMKGVVGDSPSCNDNGVCIQVSTTATLLGGQYGYSPSNPKNISIYWITTDFGEHWKKFPQLPSERELTCATQKHCFVTDSRASKTNYIFETSNGGNSWTRKNVQEFKSVWPIRCFENDSCIAIASGTGKNQDRAVVVTKR